MTAENFVAAWPLVTLQQSAGSGGSVSMQTINNKKDSSVGVGGINPSQQAVTAAAAISSQRENYDQWATINWQWQWIFISTGKAIVVKRVDDNFCYADWTQVAAFEGIGIAKTMV